MKTDALIQNIVASINSGSAGVVVVKLPGGDGAVAGHSGGDVHHPGGAKIGPGKFLFARPLKFYRTFRGARESGCFNGSFARVFSAVGRTRIQHDYANILFGNLEGFGEFTSNAEGTLGSSPNR